MNRPESSLLLVVSGPSGAGKSTLVDMYVDRHPGTVLVVSATTRSPRPREVPGKDYHFLSRAEFETGIAEDAFLEFADVHGNYYGTPRDQVEAAQAMGSDVILEIDVQGGRQVRDKRPDTVLCFLTPSHPEALRARLVGRAQDSETVIQKRLKNAAEEYAALRDYQYRILNDEIEDAYQSLRAVVRAEKARLDRYPREAMVAEFQKGLAG